MKIDSRSDFKFGRLLVFWTLRNNLLIIKKINFKVKHGFWISYIIII